MKIGIDGRILKRGITGTGRYLMNLLCEIPQYDSQNEYYLFVEDGEKVLDEFYENITVKNWFIPKKMFSLIWLNLVLPRILKKKEIEIFYTPNILLPFIKNRNVRYMTVIHDIIPLIKKEFYPFFYRLYLRLVIPVIIKKADLVFTVSENSKNDIITYFKVEEKKVDIIYANALEKFRPIDITEKQSEETLRKYHVDEKFILYVGGIDYRKNIPCLIRTIDHLHEKGINKKLLIIGKRYYCDDTLFVEIEKRKEYITYIDYLEDDILIVLYNLAFCFVFPTYYEGFGIPPLEAMQSGLPVIVADNSSLPEVVGKGGIIVEADDYIKIANEIEKLMSDKDYYEYYKNAGILAAKKYSASKSAQKLVDAFKGIK
jgi:glycosyltransferase involved in cell wall biosynthesis